MCEYKPMYTYGVCVHMHMYAHGVRVWHQAVCTSINVPDGVRTCDLRVHTRLCLPVCDLPLCPASRTDLNIV